jgi:hypothetical protein
MEPTSYSAKSLSDKLGLKMDTNLAIINAPDYYDDLIGGWPIGSSISRKLDEVFDFIHYFTDSRGQLETNLPELMSHLEKKGTLWVSWPKQASGESTDMTEQVIRDVVLPHGLVDVKVVAVDDTWSALKLMWRQDNR